MQVAVHWLRQYLMRNYTDVVQGIIFATFTTWLVFRGCRPRVRVRKWILAFLTSYNTAQIISGITYLYVIGRFSVKGTLMDFLTATVCLLYPLIPLILLYRKVIGAEGPAATFLYALFFISNCLSMVIAETALQRMLLTVGLSLLLICFFWKEAEYILFQKSMLRMDRRFQMTALAFMALIGAEAELPRIVIDGGTDFAGAQLAYAVSIVGVLLLALFMTFMKFNFFAIMKYENFIREHDDDSITNARSLSYLLEHGQDLIKNGADTGKSFAVFYTDIGNFRDINMMHGYDAGNRILQRAADALIAQFPDGIVARTSGTHFTGIVPLAYAQNGFDTAAREIEELSIDETLCLRAGICPAFPAAKEENDFGISERIVSQIDLAASALRYMPDSKSAVRFYDEDLRRKEEIRLHVLANVDKAVSEKWLRVYYQPVVEVKTRRTASYEALSRWIDPVYGFLTPDRFIVPLEEVRMIYKVDLNVLRSYGREVQRIRSARRRALPISFNISRTDLESGIDIYAEIESILSEMNIAKSLVHIEITESALNGDSLIMPQAVSRFHEMGLEVWMDDFGSGYSSLNVLKDYRFDVIKIDMEFLKRFDERSKVIVRLICQMASALGIRTVAEGVETEEQYAFLKEIGCTYAQGYLFSRPLPPEEILTA